MTAAGATHRAIKVGLIAGEESGDQLGAALMRALRARNAPFEFVGVGGSAMAAEGLDSVFPIKDLSIIGMVEIVKRLPFLLRRIREAADAIVQADPDVLVVIDSPEFTHRVAAQVRRRRPRIPIIDYVSPSVWAWRPWRARAMRRYVDHVLCLLPFEPEVHRKLGGPPCTYVGHPLCERAASLRPNEDEELRRNVEPPIVLMLPGSRRGEIRRMLPVFAAAIRTFADRAGAFQLVLPTLPHLRPAMAEAVADWPVAPRIVSTQAEKEAAFRSARAALAASGTVTLELALAGVPTIAAYRVAGWEAMIVRALIQIRTVILANLVLGEKVVPEFLQERCTPDALAGALTQIIPDTPERRRQIEAFARIPAIMGVGRLIPSEKAADIVQHVAASTAPVEGAANAA